MKERLLSVVSHLTESSISQESRLVAASLVVCTLHHANIFRMKWQSVVSFLELLVLHPDVDRKECSELDLLLNVLSTSSDMRYDTEYFLLLPI